MGKHIVRITLNPAIYARSLHVVSWDGKDPESLRPREVVEGARMRYPNLSLSSAVEAVIVDLLIEEAARRGYLSGEEWDQMRRYLKLKPPPNPSKNKIKAGRKR